jgi:hypothetical protein
MQVHLAWTTNVRLLLLLLLHLWRVVLLWLWLLHRLLLQLVSRWLHSRPSHSSARILIRSLHARQFLPLLLNLGSLLARTGLLLQAHLLAECTTEFHLRALLLGQTAPSAATVAASIRVQV